MSFPKADWIYRARAEAYLQKEDLVHALADHDQIVKLRPDDYMVYLTRSFLRFENGDPAGASADTDRAVLLKPESFVPYFCRAAVTILNHQDSDRALADLDRAIALEPRFPVCYFLRGYLRCNAQNCVPAFKDFALCVALSSR